MIMNADTETEGFVELDFVIYIDEKWFNMVGIKDCSQRVNESKRKAQIQVPLNGTWSEYSDGVILQGSKTHFWYFVASMCGISSKLKLKVEMSILNSGDSQFSAEEKGLQWIYPIIFLIYLWTLYGNVRRLIRGLEYWEEVELHVLMMNLAIGLQIFGIGIAAIHMLLYTYNGYGIGVFYMFYQLFEVFSTTIVSLLMIIIASGWTIKYKEFKDADIYIPVGLFLFMINLIVVSLEKGNEDTQNNFSNYEGIPGFIMALLRLILWAWFLYSIISVFNECNQRTSDFLLSFGITSSVYFLGLPVVVIFSWCFDHYIRNKVVILMVNLIQTSVFTYLTHLFSEKSKFYKVSTLSQSTLPGKYQ